MSSSVADQTKRYPTFGDHFLPNSIRNYLPAIYATIAITALTLLDSIYKSRHSPMIMTSQIMNAFMGFYFLVYGLPKFVNLRAFAESIKEYDPISRNYPAYASAYPFIEVVIGLLYLLSDQMRSLQGVEILNGFVVIISAASIVGISKRLRTKAASKCHCLGSNFNMPLSKVAIVENAVMLVMAMSMIVTYKPTMIM